MMDTQNNRLMKIVTRTISILLVALCIGWTLNRISITLEKSAQPAGFFRGLLQGALMPMSMPNLLVGNDVVIYSVRNSGLRYKLGYTMGVNLCGMIFFGAFFWRVTKWKQKAER